MEMRILETSKTHQSDELGELFTAFSMAQAEMPQPKRNAKNPHFGNKFADLPEVIETTKPVLTKHGLSITQAPEGRVEANVTIVGVRTWLCHKSGQWMSSVAECALNELPPGVNLAQAIGLVTTYLRRYGWSAMAGVHSEDDQDGEGLRDSTGKNKPPPAGSSTNGSVDDLI